MTKDIDIGQWIKDLRAEHGYAQVALGDILGVGESCISRWESGQRRPPYSAIMVLAAYFKVDVPWREE